jgi:hypothetical protein
MTPGRDPFAEGVYDPNNLPNYLEPDPQGIGYRIKDPSGAIAATNGVFDPNYNYGPAPYFENARKFLSYRRDAFSSKPSDMSQRDYNFLYPAKVHHFQFIEKPAMVNRVYDPNKHGFGTTSFYT